MLLFIRLQFSIHLDKPEVFDAVKKEVAIMVRLKRSTRTIANSMSFNKSTNLKKVLEDVVTSSFKKICHNNGNVCPRGRPGPPERRGRKGSQGMMRPPGRSGKQGIMGPRGLRGEKGIKGDTGAPGIPGMKVNQENLFQHQQ